MKIPEFQRLLFDLINNFASLEFGFSTNLSTL